MKKPYSFIILLLIMAVLFVGCSEKSDEEIDDNVSQEVETSEDDTSKDEEKEIKDDEDDTEEVEEKVPETEDKESILSNIFNKADKMNEYSYHMDMIVEDGVSSEGKFWISNNKVKMEFETIEGEKNVVVMDGEENLSYFYNPVDKTGVKMTYDISDEEQNTQLGAQNYVDIMKEISDDGNVKVEKGTLDGETVDIVSGEVQGDTSKMWISRKTGFPLKHESYTNGELDVTIIYSDFETGSIDPSVFTVPDDIKFTDMTQ